MKRNTRHTCRAFTFVEVMLASAFTSMLIGCFYAGMTTGVTLNESSFQRIVAHDMCQNKLNVIREASFDSVSKRNFPVEKIDLGHLDEEMTQPVTGIRSCEITELRDSSWKEITVRVEWTSRGRSYSQSVTGYLHKEGVS